jgi:aryl-alcohol dehydrogenase-like predicted oxidoreductase
MQTRPLGNTGLQVSILGFGGGPLGGEYGAITEAEGVAAVHAALDAGVNFIDVAPYYGRTLAEERLGRALEGRRDAVLLASKCCRYDLRGFDFSAARVHQDIDACLRRLRTDHLDLFQIHDVEFGDRRQLLDETLPALRSIKEAGKARFIGITGLALHLLHDLARQFPVDTVQSYCHYNLMADDLTQVLTPLARERGIGLINASPLHMGILCPGGPPPWHPAPAQVHEVGRRVTALCRERGRSVVEVALRFALDGDGVATTLCGMKNPAEVAQNLRVLEQASDPALLAQIAALVAPVKNRTWHEGLAENAPPTT